MSAYLLLLPVQPWVIYVLVFGAIVVVPLAATVIIFVTAATKSTKNVQKKAHRYFGTENKI